MKPVAEEREEIWRRMNGRMPSGMQVIMMCGGPNCVNPLHMLIGNDAAAQRTAEDAEGAVE